MSVTLWEDAGEDGWTGEPSRYLQYLEADVSGQRCHQTGQRAVSCTPEVQCKKQCTLV
jgi:hypothetical protein